MRSLCQCCASPCLGAGSPVAVAAPVQQSGPRELLTELSGKMPVQKRQVGGPAGPAGYSSEHRENVIFFLGDGP